MEAPPLHLSILTIKSYTYSRAVNIERAYVQSRKSQRRGPFFFAQKARSRITAAAAADSLLLFNFHFFFAVYMAELLTMYLLKKH